MSHFNSNHDDTIRILDVQRMDIENNACKCSYIQPILEELVEAMTKTKADVDEDSPNQISHKLQVAFLVF